MSNEIKQTSQAILLEEFDTSLQAKSLATMLSTAESVDDVRTPEFLNNVREELGVQSFHEFMTKFAPVIYEIDTYERNEKTGTASYYATYTTNEEEAMRANGRKIPLTEDSYFQILEELYSKKGLGQYSNSEFQKEIGNKLLESISTKKDKENIDALKKDFAYVATKYYEAKKNGEDARPYAKKIRQYRKNIHKQSTSLMKFLPSALEDVSQKLQFLGSGKSPTQQEETKALPASDVLKIEQGGTNTIDEQGNLEYVPVKQKDESSGNAPAKTFVNTKIRQMIVADYTKNHANNANEFVKALLADTYAPKGEDYNALVALSPEEKQAKVEELEAKKEQYNDCLVRTKDNFIQEMTKIIEKIIGVKTFFDHATAQGGDYGTLELEHGLIIANCKPASLVNARLKDKFAAYINSIGKGKGSDKCWFGILPNVFYENDVDQDDMEDDLDDDLEMGIDMSDFDEPKAQKTNEDILDLASATAILKIMDEGHILTVFNFKADKTNVFNTITASSIQQKKKLLENVNFAHAVYAYPDFTLINDHNTKFTDDRYIEVPDFYVDAAYPAAGLLVASQQKSTLKARGLGSEIIEDKDNMNFVRVDLEDEKLRTHLTTKFNRENIMNWDQSVIQEIRSDMFGFAFCGNELRGNVKNTWILTARTLKKTGGNIYEPIYRRLLNDFIYEIAAKLGNDMDQIRKYLLGDYKAVWQDAAKAPSTSSKINLVLRPGEDIVVENGKLNLVFNKETVPVSDIVNSENIESENGKN